MFEQEIDGYCTVLEVLEGVQESVPKGGPVEPRDGGDPTELQNVRISVLVLNRNHAGPEGGRGSRFSWSGHHRRGLQITTGTALGTPNRRILGLR